MLKLMEALHLSGSQFPHFYMFICRLNGSQRPIYRPAADQLKNFFKIQTKRPTLEMLTWDLKDCGLGSSPDDFHCAVKFENLWIEWALRSLSALKISDSVFYLSKRILCQNQFSRCLQDIWFILTYTIWCERVQLCWKRLNSHKQWI